MTINTEKAFDMLPYAVEIIEKVDMRGYILRNKGVLNTKDKDDADKILKDKGFDFAMHIHKNTGKIKSEVFEILAIVHDKPADEIKAQPFSETILQLKVLLQDKELIGFFKSAM